MNLCDILAKGQEGLGQHWALEITNIDTMQEMASAEPSKLASLACS